MKKCCACNKLESDYESSCSVCGSPLISVPGEQKKPVIRVDTVDPPRIAQSASLQKKVPMVKRCTNCDNIEGLDKVCCSRCGGDLRSVSKPVPSASPPKAVQMIKKCANCDHIEQPGKNQCSRCGGYLLSVPQNSNSADRNTSMRQDCPKCGSVNYGGRKKCIHCGVELEVPEKVEQNAPSYTLGEGHAICILVTLVLTVLSVMVAYCCLGCASEADLEMPDFYPFSVIAPAITECYFMAQINDVNGIFSFCTVAAVAGSVVSFVFFCGLLGKKRWAGEYLAWSGWVPVLMILMDMIRVMLYDVREPSFFDGNSGPLWIFCIAFVLIEAAVCAYYRKRLDSLVDE